ncbi:MAG: trans-2-enoyl-CoA reductase family protein [Treponema sp.]|jgi:enoyl-[acyl-carrier protein] reductase/trans-2-enoyl-CoA reductase (NAD+)|nr:trans-2-enoyl-CoA reductase family protein [Treponema sp.]
MKPMIRNNICLNSHAEGCAAVVRRQIAYVKKNKENCEQPANTPKLALVLGCSTGYGLASRITLGFGYGTGTVGVSFEKAATPNKSGTPGFYNNLTFDYEAAKIGIVSRTLDGDAFSDTVKARTIELVKEMGKKTEKPGFPSKIDLVVYSLASPVRIDPKIGVMYKSVIKPIGAEYSGTTVDIMTGRLFTARAEPATEEEIANTVKVMGGADWELWIDALQKADLLAENAKTIAYTYIGPELSWAIYKNGTIGRAKEDLEHTCKAINAKFADTGRKAYISVNKALVTRASAVIPIIPFYVSCLFKVMKEKGLHEGCIEQMMRLFNKRIYTTDGVAPLDEEGRIRIDDYEMRDDVQKATIDLMQRVTQENILTATDIDGFKHDFLEAHGFDVEGVNYEE